ncbi:MAG: flagellar hook-basal body complex protein, partial [Deltaproteobacteria bacterium]|nr:flagellar hook-basal body complex protein [Deltaproteobacteria bacterium]
MGGAISIGTTGLAASSKQMDVIGNNLANSNTLGFKAASTLFAAMLNQSLAGSGAMSVGQGVTVAAISTQFAQGSFENTPNATDMAIDGNGFFIVKDLEGALYYTRAGAFHINKEGYLVDNTDYRVQGFNLFSTAAAETADDISLSNVQSSASATTNISLGANLDAAEGYGGTFNVTQTVFDSLGGMHNLSLTFQRTEIPGMWGFDAKLSLDDGTYLMSDTTTQSACGITFDSDGIISSLYIGDIPAAAVAGGTGGGAIAGTTISKPGQLYKDTTGSITLTKALQSAWTVTGNGGYTNAMAWQEESGGVEYLKVDLDGKGGADIVFDLGVSGGTTEVATVTFAAGPLTAGDTITIAGRIFTATGAATAAQVATAFAGGAAVNGTMSGALTGYTAAAGAAGITVFTSTAEGNVANLIAAVTGTAVAPTYAYVQGAGWVTNDTVTFAIDYALAPDLDPVLTFGDLDNGATIGSWTGTVGGSIENKITWDLVGDTAHDITGYAST